MSASPSAVYMLSAVGLGVYMNERATLALYLSGRFDRFGSAGVALWACRENCFEGPYFVVSVNTSGAWLSMIPFVSASGHTVFAALFLEEAVALLLARTSITIVPASPGFSWLPDQFNKQIF